MTLLPGGGPRYEAPAPSFLSSADRARLLYVFNDTAQPVAAPASMDHHLDLAWRVLITIISTIVVFRRTECSRPYCHSP